MITYEEAGRLLALAAARDQRNVGDADILAWHADLNAAGITYADAEGALAHFYVDQARLEPAHRYRATTPDVIAIARRTRQQRLDNFVYQPAGDESPDEYLLNLRAQIAAIADGRIPAPAGTPVLEGGPHPEVAAAIEGVGQTVPGETAQPDIQRPGPLGVKCPKCTAAIGRPCRLPGGGERKPAHPARERAAKGEPVVTESGAEIERRRALSARKLAELEQAEAEQGADA